MVRSTIDGTPDLKFMAIFSENRPEWYISFLAAQSDSITVVPIAIDTQYFSVDRITELIDDTDVETLCVSNKTIQIILKLKQKNELKKLKNLITFDQPEDCFVH